jgi:hypothetical protein
MFRVKISLASILSSRISYKSNQERYLACPLKQTFILSSCSVFNKTCLNFQATISSCFKVQLLLLSFLCSFSLPAIEVYFRAFFIFSTPSFGAFQKSRCERCEKKRGPFTARALCFERVLSHKAAAKTPARNFSV